jgi:N-acyl-D-amino-acid deacylase
LAEAYDLVIENGDALLFGPDAIAKGVSIGVSGGKIAAISGGRLTGRRAVDASGRVVLPGFIDFHSHVDCKPFSAQCLARQGATTTIGGGRGFDGSAILNVKEQGFLINHGFFVSHSFTLRKAAGIDDPYRAATADEIRTMAALAEKFLESGTFGIHFGLEFVPGTSEGELLALAETARRHRRVIMIHMREDGAAALDSFGELFRVIRASGVSAHILHLAYMVGFTGVMGKALGLIDGARAGGCDVTADTGVYDAFPACLGSPILDSGWEKGYGQGVTTGNLLISSGIHAGEFCTDESFAYLRGEFPNTLVTAFVLDESEIAKALKRDYVFVSTNAADGPHWERVGHPETAGTYPKLLRKYVLDEKLLSLHEAVRKISAGPARRFGIAGKGEIREGWDADLVIADLGRVRDRADYVGRGDPNGRPDGIDYVIVNGVPIVENGELLPGMRPGRMLELPPGPK